MREMGHGVHIDSANLPTSVHCARVPTLVQLVKKGPTRVPKVWEEVVLSVVGWSSKMDIGPIYHIEPCTSGEGAVQAVQVIVALLQLLSMVIPGF